MGKMSKESKTAKMLNQLSGAKWWCSWCMWLCQRLWLCECALVHNSRMPSVRVIQTYKHVHTNTHIQTHTHRLCTGTPIPAHANGYLSVKEQLDHMYFLVSVREIATEQSSKWWESARTHAYTRGTLHARERGWERQNGEEVTKRGGRCLSHY